MHRCIIGVHDCSLRTHQPSREDPQTSKERSCAVSILQAWDFWGFNGRGTTGNAEVLETTAPFGMAPMDSSRHLARVCLMVVLGDLGRFGKCGIFTLRGTATRLVPRLGTLGSIYITLAIKLPCNKNPHQNVQMLGFKGVL